MDFYQKVQSTQDEQLKALQPTENSLSDQVKEKQGGSSSKVNFQQDNKQTNIANTIKDKLQSLQHLIQRRNDCIEMNKHKFERGEAEIQHMIHQFEGLTQQIEELQNNIRKELIHLKEINKKSGEYLIQIDSKHSSEPKMNRKYNTIFLLESPRERKMRMEEKICCQYRSIPNSGGPVYYIIMASVILVLSYPIYKKYILSAFNAITFYFKSLEKWQKYALGTTIFGNLAISFY